MLPFLAATSMVSRSDLAPLSASMMLGAYVVAMLIPALSLLVMRAVLPQVSASMLARLEGTLERHADAILGTVLIVVGGVVSADAAVRLDLVSVT